MITILIGRRGFEFTAQHGGVYVRMRGWEMYWSRSEGLRVG